MTKPRIPRGAIHAATVFAFIAVPTKVMVRYLRHYAEQLPESDRRTAALAQLDGFPDSWRPPLLLGPDRIHKLVAHLNKHEEPRQ